MPDPDDIRLLKRYAEGDESAFATLFERYINLVYSTALRQVRDPSHAEEVTQAVFILFARKAKSLGPKTVLSGWLYQAARLTTASLIKREVRRQRREQEIYMQTLMEPDASLWEQISPLLDDAMGRLAEKDRNVIVLRFFENRTPQEIAATLKLNEVAARKRVSRALEKLRKLFARRGVVSTTAIIAGAISVNSIQAAPPGLAQTISAVAMAKGATASTSTLTLVKGALKIMAWTKAKTAVVTGAVLIFAVTSSVIVKKNVYPNSWTDDPGYWRLNNPPLESYPPVLVLRPTRFSGRGGGIGMEDRFLERDAAIQDLVAIAYGYQDTRIIFPTDLPQDRPRPGYDLMLTLRSNPRQKLREAIQRQFGLVGRPETFVTNVLLVRVANPNANGLRPASSNSREQPGWFGENSSVTIRDQPLDYFLSGYIESQVRQPVLDKTGLSGRYDLYMRWRPQAGETDKDAFERTLRQQLGLELVPTNMPVEMLVVKKAN